MSDCWFNLRVFLWHFQIVYGRLFKMRVHYNGWWRTWALLWKPIWLHSFDPKGGWERRRDTPCEPVGQRG